jgi:hypothetical protein
VLHRVADLHEQLQTRARRQTVLVAVLRDRHPLTSSITKYGRPVSVSRRRRPWRCSDGPSAPAPAAPASKRAITWRVSMPALMIFSATLRLNGRGLLGHEDVP